ncbi:hypothetical protein LCGC14_1290570 [marine sediment metagenome]|uniref:Uncharacterized protein n=1 Tax=marine sediment metagenome TaxID=412755 RepID=A0A0F9LDH9_9ZZZZ
MDEHPKKCFDVSKRIRDVFLKNMSHIEDSCFSFI